MKLIHYSLMNITYKATGKNKKKMHISFPINTSQFSCVVKFNSSNVFYPDSQLFELNPFGDKKKQKKGNRTRTEGFTKTGSATRQVPVFSR